MSGSDQHDQSTPHLIATILTVVVAVGLYWAMFYDMGFQSGYSAGSSKIHTEHYAANATEQIERECGGKAGLSAHECIANIVKAERESQRSESDLAAQWQAANWAGWATVVAAASALVTGIGTYFLYQQIILTREAVEDTNKSTDAMVRQNEIVELSNRPWLKLTIQTQATCQPVFSEGVPHALIIMLSARVKNFGQSPAILPDLSVVFGRADDGFSSENVETLLHNQAQNTGMGKETIFPGEERPIGERTWFGYPNANLGAKSEKEVFDPSKMFVGVGVFYKGPGSDTTYLTSNIFMCRIPPEVDRAQFACDLNPITLVDLGVFGRTR